MNEFKPGQYVVYTPTNALGKVKRVDGDRCFVYYHTGDTAASTNVEFLRRATRPELKANAFSNTRGIKPRELGGMKT